MSTFFNIDDDEKEDDDHSMFMDWDEWHDEEDDCEPMRHFTDD